MACEEAPGLVAEKPRLATVGATFLGIKGDQTHDYGYHLCDPPNPDYSEQGALNAAVGPYACALDAGMDWPASRQWLAWLITEIREDRITGIAEVIGSLDGKNVRYWSDYATPSWDQAGVPYTGSGHDTWTHVAIYRSTAKTDHRLFAGWGPNGRGDTMANGYEPLGYPASMLLGGNERGPDLISADMWGQEHFGHSPYDPPGQNTPSHRTAQLNRIEELARAAAHPDGDPVPIELDDADVVAIAQQVADALTGNVEFADLIADRVVNLLAARLDPRQ